MVVQEVIYELARLYPHKVAIINNGVSIKYGDFAKRIELLKRSWGSLELEKGSVAIVHTRNKAEAWIATLALQSLGLITVSGSNLKLLKKASISNVSCALCDEIDERLDDFFPGVRRISLLPGLLENAKSICLPERMEVSSGGGHILLTSGTTGSYKKILNDAALDLDRLSQRASIENINERTVCNIFNLGAWTAIGYRRPLLIWYVGGTIIFDSRPDSIRFLGINNETHVICGPGYIDNALKFNSFKNDRPMWEFNLSIAGASIAPRTLHFLLNKITPNVNILYACTELATSVMSWTVRNSDDDQWFKVAIDREVDVVDANGQSLVDSEGFLRIRINPLDHSCYFENKEVSDLVFRDGWFYPGDMALKNSEGYVRVLGRVGDVINVSGNKQAAGPMEEVIRNALRVSNICMFSGLLADDPGLIVVAVELNGQKLNQHVIKTVQSIITSKLGKCSFVFVDVFPRVETGSLKVDRIRLRRGIIDAHERRQKFSYEFLKR